MKALILGVTGQDGSYMADLLLSKGYEVHGLIRKSATEILSTSPILFRTKTFLINNFSYIRVI